MSEADRKKWDERYRAGAYAERDHPTALLAEWARRLHPTRALDVACGAGRNSLFLAAAGWNVDAVDISAAGLARAEEAAYARNLAIRFGAADLEEVPDDALPAGPYGLIVLVRYVNMRLMPPLVERLAEGGLLLVEEHVESAEDVVGPKSRAHRVARGELIGAVGGLKRRDIETLFYREGLVADPDGRSAALAQLVLRRSGAAA